MGESTMPRSDYDLYEQIKRGWIKVSYNSHTMSPPEHRFWHNVDKNGPILYEHLGKCWQWIGCRNDNEYGRIMVNGKSIRAHRYSYMLLIGHIENGLLVCHRCDNPSCVNPSHLFLGTDKTNSDDRDAKGRQRGALGERNGRYTKPERTARGEENGLSKLTDEQVLEILMTYKRGSRRYGTVALGRKYGMYSSAIWKIVNGNNWRHVFDKWVAMGKPRSHSG